MGGPPGVVGGVAAGAAGAGCGAGAGVLCAAAGAVTAAAGGFGAAAVAAGVAAVATGFAAGAAAAAFAGGAAAAGAGFKKGIRPACQSMCASIALKIPPIIRAISSSMMPSIPLVSRPLVMSQTIPRERNQKSRNTDCTDFDRGALWTSCPRLLPVAAAVIGRPCRESSSQATAEYARRWRASATLRER